MRALTTEERWLLERAMLRETSVLLWRDLRDRRGALGVLLVYELVEFDENHYRITERGRARMRNTRRRSQG